MKSSAQETRTEKRGNILVVDNDPRDRNQMVLNLASAGYEVVEADTGEQAVNILGSADNPRMVDTILCNLRMSRINGIEAIAYFRTQHPSIPVIVLTGYADVDRAVSLLKAGVLDYLVKPVVKEELLMVIHRSISQHQLLRYQSIT
jgi:two-component system chemotaxis response regulator CheY